MPKGNATPMDRVLLVEGPDDKHVVCHLRRGSANMPPFDIDEKEGAPNLLKSIRNEIVMEGRTAVGIVIDANSDLSSRWQAVASRLSDAGIQPPSGPSLHGTIIQGSPRVGVWLMPNNNSPGELENFVENMIPCDDAVWPLSQTYIEGIPEADRKFAMGKTTRAKVHAWLAAREEPRKMGQAIGLGDLDAKSAAAQHFVTWLLKLFA